MTRPRVRIGTLMLWIAIVALVIALVSERRRSAASLAQAAAQAQALAEAEQAAHARSKVARRFLLLQFEKLNHDANSVRESAGSKSH